MGLLLNMLRLNTLQLSIKLVIRLGLTLYRTSCMSTYRRLTKLIDVQMLVLSVVSGPPLALDGRLAGERARKRSQRPRVPHS